MCFQRCCILLYCFFLLLSKSVEFVSEVLYSCFTAFVFHIYLTYRSISILKFLSICTTILIVSKIYMIPMIYSWLGALLSCRSIAQETFFNIFFKMQLGYLHSAIKIVYKHIKQKYYSICFQHSIYVMAILGKTLMSYNKCNVSFQNYPGTCPHIVSYDSGGFKSRPLSAIFNNCLIPFANFVSHLKWHFSNSIHQQSWEVQDRCCTFPPTLLF